MGSSHFTLYRFIKLVHSKEIEIIPNEIPNARNDPVKISQSLNSFQELVEKKSILQDPHYEN